MTDTLTPEERSERLSRVRSKNTKAEMRVRRLVHGLGYRYRLHVRELPGTPDLVFPSRRAGRVQNTNEIVHSSKEFS